jgi:thioester reductase-like protein
VAKDTDALAIVGMAGRFPEAESLPAFWDNLRAGRECVHFYSDAEVAAMGWNAAELRSQGHVAATPRLADADRFDASFFGYSADEAAVIDPQHRVFLEVCWEALENAGRDPRRTEGRFGVFGGQGVGNYLLYNLAPAGRLHAAQYFATVVANGPDFLCSRVAFKCGLTGPCVTVQTACSSGLVAVHLACQSLLNFECDFALAGAVSLQLLPLPGHFYDGGKSIYSPDGHSRVFDERAAGTIFGEGCGVVLLRRLEDAVEARDPIRAVIRGSAINNSGAVAAGFHAPSAKAQEEVAAEALAIADVPAGSIGYLEVHGSGSTIGDAIEVSALSRVLRQGTTASGFCGLGAVKSNVGHLGAAASMASLCKTVLALEHAAIPATILVDRVNPGLPLDGSPFRLVLETEAWPGPHPRRAAVNSYGVGGSNAHAILEEAPLVEPRSEAPGPHLVTLSARTPAALRRMADHLAAHLERTPGLSMADVAFTLAVGRTEMQHRRTLVCADVPDAIVRLRESGDDGVRDAGDPRIVLILSGGDGRDEPELRRLAARWSEWGVRADGLFAWGTGAHVARSLPGLPILPDSAGGETALDRLRDRAGEMWIDAYCGFADALATLGRLWVRGAGVDWGSVFGGPRRRVPLPTYPFERERHWVDSPARPGVTLSVGPEARAPHAPPVAAAVPRSLAADGRTPSPATPLQAAIRALCLEASGLETIGLDDNFFALGGTSLQLADLHARLRASILAELTVVDVFSNPTVRGIAEQVERLRREAPSSDSEGGRPRAARPAPAPGGLGPAQQALLRSAARLDDAIRPASASVSAAAQPAHVLLTGASGFLGVFLLKELIRQTRASIYCHVRAADPAAGLARIRAAMQARSLWDDADAGRIVPVCGDLGDPRLGVGEAEYGALAERIDTIVHNGAIVNFTPPYAALERVNVGGTIDLLRFACTGPAKTVHFVSSTGVWAGRFPVEEDDPLDSIDFLDNGYVQTKWVAERLVQMAADRGVPVTIHRPPRVIGDSRTGSANLDDFVARAIKGCAQLGLAPAGHFFDVLAPVDFVARAIVAIALSPGATDVQRFHIVPAALVSWRTILDFMPAIGLPLEVVPYGRWRDRLIADCQEQDNALKALLPLFPPDGAGGFAEIPVDADLSQLPAVPCRNATAFLAPRGIVCPPLDTALLEVLFGYFFEVGFLTRPPIRVSP